MKKARYLFPSDYMADPSVHVFNDKLYIYPSHDWDSGAAFDDDGGHFEMKDYHALTLTDIENEEATDCGKILDLQDIPWAGRQLWDNDVVEKDGKYYLIFCAKDKNDVFHLGVAVADRPEGPFKPQADHIRGSYSIDPCVFKDDDGSIYVYFGGLWGGQLQRYKDNKAMGKEYLPEGDEPALPSRVVKMTDDVLQFAEEPKPVLVVDENGKPLTLVGSSLVITTRKKMEMELTTARDRAEESNRLKSAFLANMSHEIRTPLNAIIGFSNILASTEEEQEKQEYINIIESNNTLLLQLISDILDLSKIEAGTLEFSYSNIDLNDMIKEVENITKCRMEGSGVQLIAETPLSSCFIRTEKNRLMQVINNFLTNAIKFTQKGSITFGYEIRDKMLYFHVTDTGCGIPANKKDSIFGRFVKLNSFAQGTGLGLSICRTIIEHMNGTIGVESEEGKGSTFWFTIPYQPARLSEKKAEEFQPITVQKDKLTILIAEDNESNYRLFQSILRKEYSLIHAWDGQEAIEKFKEHQPQIILMDINMPRMDGYEATKEIRKLSADVPIIAITAFAYASDEQRVLENGFDGYMSKPINAPLLKQQIASILQKRIIFL